MGVLEKIDGIVANSEYIDDLTLLYYENVRSNAFHGNFAYSDAQKK